MKTVQIAGESYVPVARASEMLGYSRDYVGQLCRAGSLVCKRSSGQWFILEKDVKARSKKDEEPDNRTAQKELPKETSVAVIVEEKATPVHKIKTGTVRDDVLFFDKEEYVTSARAAEITGYAQDYVGELARSKAVTAQKVGRHWMIHKKSILDHKKEKDALLAGVQADSAGFSISSTSDIPNKYNVPLTTRYFTEDNTPLPTMFEKTDSATNAQYEAQNVRVPTGGFDRNNSPDVRERARAQSSGAVGVGEFFPQISTEMYSAPLGVRTGIADTSVSTRTRPLLEKSFKNNISDKRYVQNTVQKAGTVAHDSPYAVRAGDRTGYGTVLVFLILVGVVFAGYWYRDDVVAVAQNAYKSAQKSSVYDVVLHVVPGRGIEYLSE